MTMSFAAKKALQGMLETAFEHLIDYIYPNENEESFLKECSYLDEIAYACRVTLGSSFVESGAEYIAQEKAGI
jgi:hypothetical protein